MLTIKKSANGNVMMTKRPNGLYAVSIRVQQWSASGRVYLHEWLTKGARLSESEAASLFDMMAA